MPEIEIQGTSYSLPSGVTIIGRGEDADITIDAKGFSRSHARFTVEHEKLFVEDLGSKNGTFVNGKRLDGRHEIVKGDTVRLADTEVGLPQATASAPIVFPVKAESKIPRSRGARKTNYTPLIIGAVVLVIAFIAYRSVANSVPPELVEIRSLLAEAETFLQGAAPSDSLDANLELQDELKEWQRTLGKITNRFESEYKRTETLRRQFDAIMNEVSDRSRDLENKARADNELQALMAVLEMGGPGSDHARQKLAQLANKYAGTPAADKAITELQRILQAEADLERASIVRVRLFALGKAENGDFQGALAMLEKGQTKFDSVKDRFPFEYRMLKTAVGKVKGLAEKFFRNLVADLREKVSEGKIEDPKEELQATYDRIGIEELRPELIAALAEIDAIQAKRLAALRAAMADRLTQAEALEARRMYAESASKYTGLLKDISDPGLRAEIAEKEKINRLYAGAKKAILELIEREQGLKLAGTGFIKTASDAGLALEADGVTLKIGWDKIKDSEFLRLIKQVLADSESADALMVHGLALLASGQNRDADKCFMSALKLAADLPTRFPAVFAASAARIKKRKEGAAALAAAKAAAEAEREAARKGAPIPPPVLQRSFASGEGNWRGSPIVADINGDGKVEIIVTSWNTITAYSVSGSVVWSRPFDVRCFSGAILGDLDGNGTTEVILGDNKGSVRVWTGKGEPVAGWPQKVRLNADIRTIACADVNADGKDEVIVFSCLTDSGCEPNMYMFHGDGKVMDGWPHYYPEDKYLGKAFDHAGAFNTSLAVGDIDGDGKLEAFFPQDYGTVSAFKMDGTPVWTKSTSLHWGEVRQWPQVPDAGEGRTYFVEYTYSPALIADIDLDGTPEIMAVPNLERGTVGPFKGDALFVWNPDQSQKKGFVPNKCAILDEKNWGEVQANPTVIAGNIIGGPKRELIVSHIDGSLQAFDCEGKELWLQQLVPEGAGVFTEPLLADLDKDGISEVIVIAAFKDKANKESILFVIDGKGRKRCEFKIQAKIWAAPTIADIDSDGRPELVCVASYPGSDGKQVYVFKWPVINPSVIVWPTGGGNYGHTRCLAPPGKN